MNWEQLFTTQRQKESVHPELKKEPDIRNSFQRDYDRIVFSGPFRRMQDKTQVFPLPGPIFVHNRLTHSMEVASVGRSLASLIGQGLCARHAFSGQVHTFYSQHLSWVIAAACLAHDIGNPPFGHSGEDAIRTFFREMPANIAAFVEQHISAEQLADLQHFEGNSMAFRILAQEQSLYNGGFNLTLTTIASMIKYPSSSLEGFNKSSGNISRKKSGYFQSEKPVFEKIAHTFSLPIIRGTGSVYARHPFVFLTEAADDICYRVIDMEDAHRLHIIDKQTIFDLFLPFFSEEKDTVFERKKIEQTLRKITSSEEQVAYIRATWINWMVHHCARFFMEKEEALLEGRLNQPLIDLFPGNILELLQDIDQFSFQKIYQYPSSVEIELGGYTILAVLLEELLKAVFHPQLPKSQKIYRLLSWQESRLNEINDTYLKVMFILDFVTGCTDSYAMDLYKKLRAIAY